MKRGFIRCLFAVIFLLVNLCAFSVTASARVCTYYSGSNAGAQNYDRWSSTVKSYIFKQSGTVYMTVFGREDDYSASAEYYDTNYNIKKVVNVKKELPVFGAFYGTDKYFFLITGQNNKDQSEDVEIYRITKYDRNWKRLGSVGLYDCNTTVPFDAGSCRVTDNGTYMIIRTCHEMYNGHQANVTIEVNMENLAITDSYTSVMNTGYGYVSHSFNQFVKIENNKIVAVDHGDAYPRSAVLINYKTNMSTGKFVPGYGSQCAVKDVMTYMGNTGANDTGATIGGFDISDTSYIVVGNSIKQDSNYASRSTRNIYVCSVGKSGGEVTTRWYTSLPEGTQSTQTPHLVKINSNKFMILWGHNGRVYYAFMDGNGKKTSKIYSMQGTLSDCPPIYTGSKVIWFVRRSSDMDFYEIKTSKLSVRKVVSVCNDHDMSGVTVNGTTATLNCSKCGKTITVKDVNTDYNIWWNKTSMWSTYYSNVPSGLKVGDTLNVWTPFNTSGGNRELSIKIEDESIMSLSYSSQDHFSFVMKKSGSTKLTISSKWNPTKTRTVTINVAAVDQTADKSVLAINGYQMNTSPGGVRIAYTVASTINDKQVIEKGVLLGLKSKLSSEEEMYVNSNSQFVFCHPASSSGKMSTTLGGEGTTSYVITFRQNMDNITVKGLNDRYYIRAYAELSDGSYVYTKVYNYSIYGVANALYTKQYMGTEVQHNFLYDKILSVAKPAYEKIAFSGTPKIYKVN